VITLEFRRSGEISYRGLWTNNRKTLEELKSHYQITQYKNSGLEMSSLIDRVEEKFRLPVTNLMAEYGVAIESALYMYTRAREVLGTSADLATNVRDFFGSFFRMMKTAKDLGRIRIVFVTGVPRRDLSSAESGPNCFEYLTSTKNSRLRSDS